MGGFIYLLINIEEFVMIEELREAAERSDIPFAEYIETAEDLLSTGYTVEEVIKMMEE